MWTVFAVLPGKGMFVQPGLANGWLCFETTDIVLRLSPIPDGWSTAPPARLEEYLAKASEPLAKSPVSRTVTR